jgi:RNA polymerase sigma-70 factor (ECF subfamily)
LKRRRRHHALHAALKLAQPAFGDTGADPEQSVIRAEALRGIERAVFDLDENHQLPIILRYYHELSVSDIAEIMNLREGTVHSRLFNARKRMHDQMKARDMPYTEKKGARQ